MKLTPFEAIVANALTKPTIKYYDNGEVKYCLLFHTNPNMIETATGLGIQTDNILYYITVNKGMNRLGFLKEDIIGIITKKLLINDPKYVTADAQPLDTPEEMTMIKEFEDYNGLLCQAWILDEYAGNVTIEASSPFTKGLNIISPGMPVTKAELNKYNANPNVINNKNTKRDRRKDGLI